MQQRCFYRLQAWMPYFLRDPVHDERQAAVTRVFEVLSGWARGGARQMVLLPVWAFWFPNLCLRAFTLALLSRL